MSDNLNCGEVVGAQLTAGSGLNEIGEAKGHYDIECRDMHGNLLWTDGFDNLVTTLGQDQILASGVAGSTPAYMGLISSTSFGTIVAGDIMGSHAGWIEAAGTTTPNYSGNRPTLTFGAAASGSIATTGTNTFTFTNGGTVEGAFIVFGASASATQGSTAGVLMSAGKLTTAQPVIDGNIVTMSYTLSL